MPVINLTSAANARAEANGIEHVARSMGPRAAQIMLEVIKERGPLSRPLLDLQRRIESGEFGDPYDPLSILQWNPDER